MRRCQLLKVGWSITSFQYQWPTRITLAVVITLCTNHLLYYLAVTALKESYNSITLVTSLLEMTLTFTVLSTSSKTELTVGSVRPQPSIETGVPIAGEDASELRRTSSKFGLAGSLRKLTWSHCQWWGHCTLGVEKWKLLWFWPLH